MNAIALSSNFSVHYPKMTAKLKVSKLYVYHISAILHHNPESCSQIVFSVPREKRRHWSPISCYILLFCFAFSALKEYKIKQISLQTLPFVGSRLSVVTKKYHSCWPLHFWEGELFIFGLERGGFCWHAFVFFLFPLLFKAFCPTFTFIGWAWSLKYTFYQACLKKIFP